MPQRPSHPTPHPTPPSPQAAPHHYPLPPPSLLTQFGEIDIDSELVARTEVLDGTKDTIVMLNNGCLCCTVREDLVKALNNLYSRRKEFDHILIETTGLANPAPIITSFFLDKDLPDRWVWELCCLGLVGCNVVVWMFVAGARGVE
jgi:hypothetical protein